MADAAFSPAVSVYSSLLASWKFAVAAGQTKVADAIHDVMDLAWLELSVDDRNRWFRVSGETRSSSHRPPVPRR